MPQPGAVTTELDASKCRPTVKGGGHNTGVLTPAKSVVFPRGRDCVLSSVSVPPTAVQSLTPSSRARCTGRWVVLKHLGFPCHNCSQGVVWDEL